MFLAYLDETQSARDYYGAALIVRDVDAQPLADALDAVATYAVGTYGAASGYPELHAYAIANGKEDWVGIKSDYDAQKDILWRAVNVLADSPVAVYIRGVNIKKYQARYGTNVDDMHGTALAWTLERVQIHARSNDDVALVIADERRGTEARYREALRWYQKKSTFGWKAEKLDRVVDTIHFAPSTESRLLQAADIAAWAHVRSLATYKNAALQEFQQGLWSRLLDSGRIREASAWDPQDPYYVLPEGTIKYL